MTATTGPVPALRPIRILPAPQNRPAAIALDGRLDATDGGENPAYVQDALAVDFEWATDEQLFGPQATRRADLPDPQEWAAHIAQAIVEVMAGTRSAPQVLRWTTPEVYDVVARRGALSARRGVSSTHRAQVRRVVVCEPVDGVAEAGVVVIDGTRVRALALRLVGLDGRWRVEALQVG